MIEEWTAKELTEQKRINENDPEYLKWLESGKEFQEDEVA